MDAVNLHWLWGLCAFSLAATITPGPNNIMLLNSGVSFGFKRTIPHIFGINLGSFLVFAIVGLGAFQIFKLYPISYPILKALGISYLLYLAYSVYKSATEFGDKKSQQPMSFMQAALFQWVNPKVWMMGMSAFSGYVPPKLGAALVILAAFCFAMAGLPCVIAWALFGAKMRDYLKNPRYLCWFNRTMAILLLLSLVPMFFSAWHVA